MADQALEAIVLLILDVDGVLTDGGIVLSENGDVIKEFCVRDGLAIKLWRNAGGKIAILSARQSAAVDRRAAELGIELVVQGQESKIAGYERILEACGVTDDAVCYIGDDLADLPVLRRVGLPVAPADAVGEVKRWARWVTAAPGGAGAVREVIERLMKRRGVWRQAMESAELA